MTEAEIVKLREKLKKLMNMTVENGCTEDEQESAMRMAAGLAARAGIESELESLRTTGSQPATGKAIKKTVRQEFKIHQVLAAQAAAELYGCDLFLYDKGRGGLLFVGREENVESAETTMFWLMRQVELLYKQNLPRGLTQSARAEYRKTFKAACAHRVWDRARDLMMEMRSNERAAQAATGQNALVVQGYFKQLHLENQAAWDLTPEQKAAAEARSRRYEEEEERRRNALTPYEREQEDREKERERKKRERQAAKRKGPRPRTIPVGNGTAAGRMAGDSVRLRTEIK